MLRNFDTPFGKYFVEIGDGLIRHAYFGEFDAYSDIMQTGDQAMSKLHRYCCATLLVTRCDLFAWQLHCNSRNAIPLQRIHNASALLFIFAAISNVIVMRS